MFRLRLNCDRRPELMHLIESATPLAWGQLDLPLFGIAKDWHDESVEPAAAWSLAMDARHLWFVAGHGSPARLHPEARPGRYLPGLWRHDVAELFLADPASGRYLELNLAPNGAWWSCGFTAPRVRAEEHDIAIPEVDTFAELSPDGSWLAAMAIPLGQLRSRVNFGKSTTANVTFILGSPRQRFLSAADLGGGEPDFHRPRCFPRLAFIDGGLFAAGGAP